MTAAWPRRDAVLAAVSAGVFVALAGLLAAGWLGRFDRALHDAVVAPLGPTVQATLERALSFPADPAVAALVVAASALLLAWKSRQDRAALLVVASAALLVAIPVLKAAFGRDRPTPGVSLAFPSGHALAAAVVYGLAVSWLAPAGSRLRWIWPAAMLAVGLGRFLGGVHWATDVVAGWAAGTLWVVAVRRLEAVSTSPPKS